MCVAFATPWRQIRTRKAASVAARSVRTAPWCLVAAQTDAQLAERVVALSGGHLDMSDVRYGAMSFVP